MNLDSLHFAEALATRLCHDFAGPLSATANGLELLGSETDPAMQEQARALLFSSAREGVIRLQFYRTAFGQLKDIKLADVNETRQMALDFFAAARMKLDWPEGSASGFDTSMPNALRQLLCAMLLVTSSMMIYGGTLKIYHQRHPGKGGKLVLSGSHTRIKKDDSALGVLKEGIHPSGFTPYNVIPTFLASIAASSQVMLNCNITEGAEGISLEFIAEYPETLW